jgi:HD-like signal output (HDOD) protein
MSALEKETFGFTHAEVGAVAANRWNLSDPVCMTILYHHNPIESTQAVFLTRIINVADSLAYFKNQKAPLTDEFMNSIAVSSLNFTAEQLETVWEKVVEQLREAVKVFFR